MGALQAVGLGPILQGLLSSKGSTTAVFNVEVASPLYFIEV